MSPLRKTLSAAIPLRLEALRKIKRYGIGQGNEQYIGFRALGSGISMPAAQMTELEALEFLCIHAGWDSGPDYDDPEDIDRAYRQPTVRQPNGFIPPPAAG